ncbi:hypothetical protein Tco_1475090 [Tanacetum coccineum]
MEDEFYNFGVKGNDLKTYIRRFQELAALCPNMVPNAEKLMEVFTSGLPRSIEGNVTASKSQTLEEAINIAQSLMDQIIKCDSVKETNNHTRSIKDKEAFRLMLYNGIFTETFPCVKDVDYIIRDLAEQDVRSSKRRFEDLKPREQDTRRTSGNTTRNDPFPPFLLLEAPTQIISQLHWEAILLTLRKTPNLFDSTDPITSPAILTPSLILPPSLLFDPRYFFVPEELLPPKKRIHSPSSSSTTFFNSSRNQTRNLVSPSSSVYTPTPPQIFEIGKCSTKMHLKHHEGQIKDILNYLDELYLHHIEKIEEGRIDRMISEGIVTKLKNHRTPESSYSHYQTSKKQLGQK